MYKPTYEELLEALTIIKNVAHNYVTYSPVKRLDIVSDICDYHLTRHKLAVEKSNKEE